MTPIQYLKEWIINDLSKPQSDLNDLAICPFAKTALDSDKIEFVYTSKLTFPRSANLKNLDAIVFVLDAEISSDELYDLAINFNKQNSHLVALEDHPLEPEVLNDIVFNNKKYPIIIVQSRQKLEHYRKILEKQQYYKNWTTADLTDLINR